MEEQKIEMVIQTSHVNIKLLLTINEAVENMNRLEKTIKEAQQPVADMIKKVNGNASPEIKNIEPREDVDKVSDTIKFAEWVVFNYTYVDGNIWDGDNDESFTTSQLYKQFLESLKK